jgi:hypothetical protein
MKTKQRFPRSMFVPCPCSFNTKQSNLEFELRVQEFIELVRIGQKLPAITYFRKHLVPFEKTHRDQIQRAAALLAFPPDTEVQPYKVFHPLNLSNLEGYVCSGELATTR